MAHVNIKLSEVDYASVMTLHTCSEPITQSIKVVKTPKKLGILGNFAIF